MQNEKKPRKPVQAQQAASAFVNQDSLLSDPNGSYTGQPAEKNEKPVQDADDL